MEVVHVGNTDGVGQQKSGVEFGGNTGWGRCVGEGYK